MEGNSARAGERLSLASAGSARQAPAREDQLPKSNDIDFDKGWQNEAMSETQLAAIAERWRYQKR